METAGVRFNAIADALNERQRTYLLAVYNIDQEREAQHKGFGAAPSRLWRWIEYGPDAYRSETWDGPLRASLAKAGMIDLGSGSTWSALKDLGLVESKQERTSMIVLRWAREINVMYIRMTPKGRKVARLLLGLPMAKSKNPKPLTLSALRLIEWGQTHQGKPFGWSDPWEGTGWLPDYLMMLAITRGMQSRGLISGDATGGMTLTAAGMALDVTTAPNWKRRGRPGCQGQSSDLNTL